MRGRYATLELEIYSEILYRKTRYKLKQLILAHINKNKEKVVQQKQLLC